MSEGPTFTTDARWAESHIQADQGYRRSEAPVIPPKPEHVPDHLAVLHLIGALSFIYGYTDSALGVCSAVERDRLETIKAKAFEGLVLAGIKVAA